MPKDSTQFGARAAQPCQVQCSQMMVHFTTVFVAEARRQSSKRWGQVLVGLDTTTLHLSQQCFSIGHLRVCMHACFYQPFGT
jgi:hypothetical protein